MARYKGYDCSQGSSYRYTLTDKSCLYLIDNEIDLSIFDTRYRNDVVGGSDGRSGLY